MSKARNLSDFISDASIDATEIADGAVTAAKLHTSLDLSSKTVTFADDHISGNKIHGGVISAFASTGIDDNASSTAVTIDSSGNVGINRAAPASIFHIETPSSNPNQSIRLDNPNGSGLFGFEMYRGGTRKAGMTWNEGNANLEIRNYRSDAAYQYGNIDLFTGGTNATQAPDLRMRITTDGNVGIGTSNPQKTLHTYGSGGQQLRVESSDSWSELYLLASGTNTSYLSNSNNLQIWTNGNRAISVDAQQKVGIGTSSPANPLHVEKDSTNSATMTLINSNASSGAFVNLHAYGTSPATGSQFAKRVGLWGWNANTDGVDIVSGANGDSGNSNDIRLYTNSYGTSSERVRIDKNGTVGIATKTADTDYKLYVNGYSNSAGHNVNMMYIGKFGTNSVAWTTEYVLLQEWSYTPPTYIGGKYYFQSWTHGSMGDFVFDRNYQDGGTYCAFTNVRTKGGVTLKLQRVTYNGTDYIAFRKHSSNGGELYFNGYVSGIMNKPWLLQVVTSGVTEVTTFGSS